MKKLMLMLMITMCFVGCFNKVEKEKIVAKVGRQIYSVDDINERIKTLDPQLQTYFGQKENYWTNY